MRNFEVLVIAVVIFPSLLEVTKGTHNFTGYVENPNDGIGYKLMYHAQKWTAARDSCENIGAKLAVPKTKEQFTFIQSNIVRKMHYPSIVGSRYKLLVWLGISNIDDFGPWKNIDGENIENTGFYTWASKNNGHISTNPKEPHCVGMDAINIGLRDWWCNHPQPYICEMPI